MNSNAVIADLHLKFAEKTWNETFQLVRRCMVRHISKCSCTAHLLTCKLFQSPFKLQLSFTFKPPFKVTVQVIRLVIGWLL